MKRPPKGQQASVGVALISRNAAKTLGRCLDSIRPFVSQIVVCVDETTTDKTAEVAKKHRADVVAPVKVSDYHECPAHGLVLAQHFANARNESFKLLDPALDWWMWIDSDDILKGGELLAETLTALDPEFCGVWLPYYYATANDGAQVTTLFDRERILRSASKPTWDHRVHETIRPTTMQPRYIGVEHISVWHQEGGHTSQHSAKRNLLLCEIDLEENGQDSRAWFYLGNQHWAMGNPAKAVEAWERLNEVGENPYEMWQANCYLSLAYEALEDLDNAKMAAFAAMDWAPEHPEPYFRLASVYRMLGEDGKVEFWTKLGRDRKPPPRFVFRNPLDYTYNNRLCLADSFVRQGRIPEARRELQEAYRAYPSEHVEASVTRYAEIERAASRADAFVALAAGKTDAEIARLWETAALDEDTRAFGRVRDVAMPAILRQRPATQPHAVFFCGRAPERWYPGTLNTTGIGGSETAVVEIARRFAADGWRVDVYNDAGPHEGIYDEVGYWDSLRWDNQPVDLLVSWRRPSLDNSGAHRGKLLWCHDLNYGPGAAEGMRAWDRVMGVSAWHAGMLRRYYDLPAEAVAFVPNGIDLGRFAQPIKKVPFRAVYASSPDRGLAQLLRMWPSISSSEQSAELHVGYGWENVDSAIERGDKQLAAFKAEMVRLIERTPGVVWRGRLPQDQLARLYAEAVAWLYPSHFLEVSCISAMEAMAGGAVPVTSAAGALKETVGPGGLIVPGNVYGRPWGYTYIQIARAVLFETNTRRIGEALARERGATFSWDAAYRDHWCPLVTGLLDGKPGIRALAGVS